MNVYAYISILEALLKLGIVYLLVIVSADKLIVYGMLVFAVQLIIRIVYQMYCRRHYEESRFKLFWDKALYQQMSGFAGWNLFGSVAWLVRDQGTNIVLNLFSVLQLMLLVGWHPRSQMPLWGLSLISSSIKSPDYQGLCNRKYNRNGTAFLFRDKVFFSDIVYDGISSLLEH